MSSTTEAMASYMAKHYGKLGEKYLSTSQFCEGNEVTIADATGKNVVIIQSKINNDAAIICPKRFDNVKEKKVDFYRDIYQRRKWEKLRLYYNEQKKVTRLVEFRPWKMDQEDKYKLNALHKTTIVTQQIAI